jgi:viologen exporter family transport system permease protein
VRRYLRLLALQLRMSLTVGAAYRWDFLLQSVLALVWTYLGLVPLFVALHGRPPVEGWTYEQALVVVGCFTIMNGVLYGAVSPSLIAVVEHIRKGTLDFVLMKPADAQFLVSTAKFEPQRVVDVLAGVGIVVWAFALMHTAPAVSAVAVAVTLLVVAVAVLYSICILAVAAAFWVVRLDNLTYLLNSILDFGRWPIGIFKGFVRLFFTIVIPIALMTTYPAEALLGRLSARTGALGILGSVAFTFLGRLVWTRALGRYTSASS